MTDPSMYTRRRRLLLPFLRWLWNIVRRNRRARIRRAIFNAVRWVMDPRLPDGDFLNGDLDGGTP